jgi:hypothetical protein
VLAASWGDALMAAALGHQFHCSKQGIVDFRMCLQTAPVLRQLVCTDMVGALHAQSLMVLAQFNCTACVDGLRIETAIERHCVCDIASHVNREPGCGLPGDPQRLPCTHKLVPPALPCRC